MENCNRDPRMHIHHDHIRPKDDEIRVTGCPGNSFDIATRKYVMAVLGGHNIDPNAHFAKFQELESKIDEITGNISTSSIQICNAYGIITNQIRADLTVLVDGVLKKLATTDDLTSVSPTAITELVESVKALQENVAGLHSSVETLTGTTAQMNARISNLETRVDTVSGSVVALDGKVSDLETTVGTLKGTTESIESKLNGFGTDVENLTDDVSSLKMKVSDIETTVSVKQDALYFSSDFLTGDGNVTLNYGTVSENGDLPVKGKDIYTSFTEISGDISKAVIETTGKEISGGIAETVSGDVLAEVKSSIPTITFKSL